MYPRRKKAKRTTQPTETKLGWTAVEAEVSTLLES
jgi:hypothetical protein